jgi:hypothetical protein
MRRNITQAIGAVLLGLCALLSPAASQTQPDAVQLYMLQLLGSPDPALRQRAQRELEAAAPTFPPPALFLVASRLAEAGEFEAALYWSHIAEIRLRTDAALFPAGLTGIGIDSNGFAEMMTVWSEY